MIININLDGPEGNAFFIIAAVRNILRQKGTEPGEIERINTEMMMGNYRHLLRTANTYCGENIEWETQQDFEDMIA